MGLDITGIGSILDIGSKIIDRVWPDPAQRDAAKLELFKAQQAGEFKALDQVFELAKGQIGVNTVEASSSSLFVSGWRPGSGWICNCGLAYTFVLRPLFAWLAAIKGWPTPPEIDINTLMVLLGSLLGIGGLRSLEKVKNVAK